VAQSQQQTGGTSRPCTWRCVPVLPSSLTRARRAVSRSPALQPLAHPRQTSDCAAYSYASATPSLRAAAARLRSCIEQRGPDALPAVHSRCGVPVHTAYAPAAVADMLGTPPLLPLAADGLGAGRPLVHITTLGQHLIACLTGTPVDTVPVSPSEAAWTGMASLSGPVGWQAELWGDLLGCELALPRIEVSGCLHMPLPSAASPLGRLARALRGGDAGAHADVHAYADVGVGVHEPRPSLSIHLPISDGHACAVVAAAMRDRVGASPGASAVALTVGTSAALRALLPADRVTVCVCSDPREPVPMCSRCGGVRLHDAGLWAYRVAENEVVVGGALTDGGSLIATSRTVWPGGVEALNTLLSCPAADPDTPGTLICLPSWSGERSTGWNPHALGAFIGVTHATTPADYVRACMEGVCHRLLAVLALLHPLLSAHGGERRAGDDRHESAGGSSKPPDDDGGHASCCVIANGGALAHSPLWARLMGESPAFHCHRRGHHQCAPTPFLCARCAANVLGLPLHVIDDAGGGAVGGGLQGTSLGVLLASMDHDAAALTLRHVAQPTLVPTGSATAVAAHRAAHARHHLAWAAMDAVWGKLCA